MKTISLSKTMSLQVAAVSTAILSVALLSAQVFAWGPDRPTYTGDHPADHVTFNSYTDNAKVGDERNFVRIRESGVGNYGDEMKLTPGKEYEVMIYYHNNASTTLNASGVGVAKDTSVKAQMPSIVKPGERGKISGTISASNATPQSVWDEAYVTSSQDIALRYVPGSAKITSNGAVNGQTLPDSLFTTGALIGYDSLNGVLPGCTQYSGYVIYKFKADAPGFNVTKQVSPSGAKKWQSSYKAKFGEKVDYKITYTNTGTTTQNNVNIKDTLPAGESYVKGSSILYNATNPKGIAVSDNVTTTGINIGNYLAGGNAVVTYSATISDKSGLVCGPNTLNNRAEAITSAGTKWAIATVETQVECAANECKPGIPEGDARCATPKQECAEGQVKDEQTGECITSASTLPTTGPTEIIMSIIGVGAMAAGIAYWIKSRRELEQAIASAAGNHSHSDSSDAPKLLTARTDSKASDDKKEF